MKHQKFVSSFFFKNNTKLRLTLILLFITNLFVAQNRVITGTITSNTNQVLPNANIIAKPQQANEQLKFCIANAKGEYKIGLEKQIFNKLKQKTLLYYFLH